MKSYVKIILWGSAAACAVMVALISSLPLLLSPLRYFGISVVNRFGNMSAYASLSCLMCIFFRNFIEVSVVALVVATMILTTALGEMLELIYGIGESRMPQIGDFAFNFAGTAVGSMLFMFGYRMRKSMVKNS